MRVRFFCLLKEMCSSMSLWGHVLLIGATNGILFGFYEEAPFVFIEQLGLSPSQYGLLGIVIAAAALLSARLTFRLSGKYPPERQIRWGAALTVVGGAGFLAIVYWGGLNASFVGLGMSIDTLFLAFFGVSMIIPNSLSIALKPYQNSIGTAGSIFGGMYYVLIAFFTWLMSQLHDGTAWPLPLFLTGLGFLLVGASCMLGKKALPVGA